MGAGVRLGVVCRGLMSADLRAATARSDSRSFFGRYFLLSHLDTSICTSFPRVDGGTGTRGYWWYWQYWAYGGTLGGTGGTKGANIWIWKCVHLSSSRNSTALQP